jgi:F-type H+-transporting ATPase subunit beta
VPPVRRASCLYRSGCGPDERTRPRAGVEALLPALRARPQVTTFVVNPWQKAEQTQLAPPFDTLLTFDPVLAKALCVPALDPFRSSSRSAAGLAGVDLAVAARALLRQENERALRLRAYLTQPFFVAEPNSGRPGEHVARADMLADVAAVLDGALDGLSHEQLLYRGRAPSAG